MLSVFLTLFYPVFLTSIAVGPIFITIANTSMTMGLKNGLFSVIGVIFGNIVYMTIGILTAQQVMQAIPETIMLFVSFFATLFLVYIAIGLWKKNLSNIEETQTFKPNIKQVIKMFTITLSSPVAITGYVITFLTFADAVRKSFVFSFLGGMCASTLAYSSIAIAFGLLGKKFKKMKKDKYAKFLQTLNRVASVLLLSFASITLFKFVKTIITMLFA